MLIQLADSPIDRVSSHALLLFFNENEKPLAGNVGLIDWRLNGRLSDLLAKRKIEGAQGEVLMIPGQGRVCSETIFLFGTGEKKAISKLVSKIRQTVRNLGVKSLAVSMTSARGTELAFWKKLGEELGLEQLVLVPPYSASQVTRDRLNRVLEAANS
ncbi:M17 family peptidase N-terminal domain-containing protein [Bdellovibrionota bacterium]